jgi:hypothetical protein
MSSTREFGRRAGEFPLLFARAVVFGQPPNSGTATLADLGSGPIAITCAHVLARYRDLRDCGRNVPFQIGNLTLDPIAQLVAEDPGMDLATIRLSDRQAAILRDDGVSGGSIFRPRTWPPPAVKTGDIIALGGFPGDWRVRSAIDELEFRGYGVGATSVSSVSETQFACQFDRDRWVWSFRLDGLAGQPELGGMSGGPAFLYNGLRFDLVGIISEFSSSIDIMFLKPARLIRFDGTLQGVY